MTTITYRADADHHEFTASRPSLLGRVRTYFVHSRAERQLAQLDDRMLADIGITRSDIHRMVWGN